ncbi:MAG: hypothetical protein KAH30_06240, partial [Caldisericia bacterium]|nr:hypothetical protein [Caldisericia bacterium]
MSKAYRMIVIICTILIIFSSLLACEKSKELVYDDSAMQIAKTLRSGARWHDGYIDSFNDFSSLANLIYNTINQFDTDCGEIDAHKSSKSNREKFYVYFLKITKDSSLLDMGYHDPNFIETFEQMFGHLPDSDKDGIPDIISRDD